jgi:hypothetical protein
MGGIGMKPKIRSLKAQQHDGELGLIIDEMGRAMWNANKEYIASGVPLTLSMSGALAKFQDFCARYYGKKS